MRITDTEKETALRALDMALRAGADAAKVCLNKSVMTSCSVLDGRFDKLAHSADRSLYFHIFADGRYGNFSTNRLDDKEIASLLERGVATVRMLAPDDARVLPDPSLYWKGQSTGLEMGIDDGNFDNVTPERKMEMALECASAAGDGAVSSEVELSDQEEASLTADTQGFEGLSYETTYAVSAEVTVKGNGAQRSSGNWWAASPMLASLDYRDCAVRALERARRSMNPAKVPSGRYNLVLENTVSSRVVAPILSALHGLSIQQENSFLKGSLGKQVFPDWLHITDNPHEYGAPGSRLFDSEGVATAPCDIIRQGTVMTYFINSYASRKLGMPQTVESPSRPQVMSFDRSSGICRNGESSLSLAAVLGKMDTGILVTGINGGNTNPVTGAFSFGIEGFLFRGGEIVRPVGGMLVTGDIISLWQKSVIAGNDPLAGIRWRIPTLAFEGMDFSGSSGEQPGEDIA